MIYAYIRKWLVVSVYNRHNSTVFMCFLDASKAFDRINHTKLFMKLQDRGVPHIWLGFYSTGIYINLYKSDGVGMFRHPFMWQMGFGKVEYYHLFFLICIWMISLLR